MHTTGATPPSSEAPARELHPLEVKVLLRFAAGEEISTARLLTELSYNLGQANQALSWLSAKGFAAEKSRAARVLYEITDFGRECREKGTYEERIVKLLASEGPQPLPEIARKLGIQSRDVGSAFGGLSKEKILTMDDQKRAAVAAGGAVSGSGSMAAVRALLSRAAREGALEEASLSATERELAASLARKRGTSTSLFRLVEREEVMFAITAAGAAARKELERSGATGEETGALTPEALKTGSWKTARFRRYNIDVPPTRVLPGRSNPYCAFLSRLKDKLASLGFEEFDGPLVETEFWNGDALFMPQFHSARDIHDVYYMKSPTHAREIEQPWLDQVAAAHENGWTTGSRGWGYTFDRQFTRRLILRSQGTVLSAKTLPRAKVPGKYFGVVRCFRYDKVDATHLADFYQTEGIVLGEEVNLRTLLGLLKMFAEEVAMAKEVKYVPGFFPFTEPSVEVHIRHPSLGWFELGGSGIFRPEVTEPLGVKVPVLAWGLGIDRMALTSMGLHDIRDLFSPSIEDVRTRRMS
ncbi:MAG TPA: phenylalanine--tRNA ligase subunit alpha [Spirochaetia bacterium]|nr:phenylalanine--tRNA ligase subunit alpha [Spirochaetia bacterium]